MINRAQSRGKDASIETLRGVAILLMVAGHVIGNDADAGMRVSDDSAYRYFYESLRVLRMPLFTAISGYVYALRPLASSAGWPKFLSGKARRLLVPMVVVGSLEFLAHALAPGVNHDADLRDIWTVLFYGYDHFWYLQAIFIVIAVVATADARSMLRSPARLAVAMTIACVVGQILPHIEFFSIAGALYLCPFFLLGVGLNRFEALNRGAVRWVCWILLICGVAFQQWTWFSADAPRMEKTNLIGVGTSLCSMVLLFAYRWTTPFLAKLGNYAYSIYLFHVLGTATARILIEGLVGRTLATPTFIVFLVSLAAGLCLPILAEQLLRKNALTALLFLGLRKGKSDAS